MDKQTVQAVIFLWILVLTLTIAILVVPFLVSGVGDTQGYPNPVFTKTPHGIPMPPADPEQHAVPRGYDVQKDPHGIPMHIVCGEGFNEFPCG